VQIDRYSSSWSHTASPKARKKFVAFLSQIPPRGPFLPVVPVFNYCTVNNMRFVAFLDTEEVAGSNPAAPNRRVVGGQEPYRRSLEWLFRKMLTNVAAAARSKIRSTKSTVFSDFGGLRRSPQVYKSLKKLERQACHGRGQARKSLASCDRGRWKSAEITQRPLLCKECLILAETSFGR